MVHETELGAVHILSVDLQRALEAVLDTGTEEYRQGGHQKKDKYAERRKEGSFLCGFFRYIDRLGPFAPAFAGQVHLYLRNIVFGILAALLDRTAQSSSGLSAYGTDGSGLLAGKEVRVDLLEV